MDAHHDEGLLTACERLIEVRRLDLAERELARWLSMHPEDAYGHALMARTLALLGRGDEALRAAGEAVRLEPEWAYTYAVTAEVSLRLGRDRDAERSARAALALNPDDAACYSMLSAALLNQRWRMQVGAALRAAEAGLAVDPAHAACARLRAQALSRLLRHRQAREAAAYALQVGPEVSATHAAAGWIAMAAGDRRRSGEHLRQAVRLDPANDDALHGLRTATRGVRTAAALLVQAERWSRPLRWVAAVLGVELGVLLAGESEGGVSFGLGYALCLLALGGGWMPWVRRRHAVLVEELRLAGPHGIDAREARRMLVLLIVLLLLAPVGAMLE